MVKHISDHFLMSHQCKAMFAGHRVKNKHELLLFVNDRESFLLLFDIHKWQATLHSLDYEKLFPKYLPHNSPLCSKMSRPISTLTRS